MRAFAYTLLALACEIGVLHFCATMSGLPLVMAGLGLHFLACCLVVGTLSARGIKCSRAEKIVVSVLAFVLPGAGTLVAGYLPTRIRKPRLSDRRQGRRSEHVGRRTAEERWRPSNADEPIHEQGSFMDAVRSGDATQKAAVIRELTNRAQPADLALVRRFLKDPEDEVRTHAFMALQDIQEEFEADLVRRERALRGGAADVRGVLDLAHANAHIARSGCLEEEMAHHYWRRVLEHIRVRHADPNVRREAVLLEAEAHKVLGELDLAWRQMDRWQATFIEDPEFALRMAELAFARRDFVALESHAARLLGLNSELPTWLAYATGRGEVEVANAS